jgi:hypothetical protein
MPDYRAYGVAEDGHYNGSRAFFCDNDEDAIVWAKRLFGDQELELWSGEWLIKSCLLRGGTGLPGMMTWNDCFQGQSRP